MKIRGGRRLFLGRGMGERALGLVVEVVPVWSLSNVIMFEIIP